MKHLKIPKFRHNDHDYEFMGIRIPKISQASLPSLMRRERRPNQRSNTTATSNIRVVRSSDSDNVISSTSADVCDSGGRNNCRSGGEACAVPRREKTPRHESGARAELESAADVGANATPGQFDDIVFSFFSSTDQTYIVHGASDGYVETNGHPIQQEPRCKSIGSGNEYEIMKPAIVTRYSSAVDLKSNGVGDDNNKVNKTTIHKSELRFFVSATSLNEQPAEKEDEDEPNYDLPSNLVVKNVSQSAYTIQNKSLNDVHSTVNGDDKHKYQNSASLDNLSQVCNVSLNNAESKRSIASLPDLDNSELNNTKKDFANGPFVFSKITSSKPSSRSDRSNYFDNSIKAIKLRNRISAFYSAHKDFKGKKRLSKAWYGLKDWFDNEKMKMDTIIQKHSQKRHNGKPTTNNDYADSEFSEYEDVANSRESIDSFGKLDEFGDSSAMSEYSHKSGRRSRIRELKDETDSEYREIRSLSACNSSVRLTSIRDGDRYFISEERQDENVLRHSKSQPSVLQISEPVLTEVNCENVDDKEVESSVYEDDREMLNHVGSASPDCTSVKSDHCEELTDAGVITAQQNEQDNFAAMKSIVKEGSVMCKELVTILQQRAEAERQYCCSVLRVGARARRASKGASWAALASRRAAIDMEARAQLHRQFSNKLVEEVIRPLQRMVSSRDSIRKQVECDVGITTRRLSELRDLEGRCKKASHAAARINERLQDTSVGRGGTPTQEADLRRKKVKSEEAANKTDIEYYMACVRAERSRVECEIAVAKGLEKLVELEEERLTGMKKALKVYVRLALMLGPGPPSEESKQLDTMLSGALKGEGRVARGLLNAVPPPMHLPDFYCLHITLAMNKERRRQALMKILELIKNDMERERKSKQALEKLSLAITTTPNFGNNESQQNVSEKLYHMRSLLTYLEGARVQAAGALLTLGGRPRPSHPLTPHITVQRDRRGLQETILQVPPWLRQEFRPSIKPNVSSPMNSPPSTPAPSSVARSSPPPSPGSSVTWSKDRGVADGVSVQHYSDIEEHIIIDTPPARPPPPVLPIVKNHQGFSV